MGGRSPDTAEAADPEAADLGAADPEAADLGAADPEAHEESGPEAAGPAPVRSAAIAVRGLRKVFAQTVAVDGISFTVPRGAMVALLGGNGAGKTTTLAMLLGLVRPTCGRIEILGSDARAHPERVLPRMNFESPYVDLPRRLTVRENLTVYARLYGVRGVGAQLDAVSRDMDLGEVLDRPVGSLSAGQKTRVGLAKALINDPDLLLLDEPTASLDPDTADWVRGYFQDWCAHTGGTIFMASHNMAEVERLCGDVLMMRAGRIVDRGSPAALLERYGRQTLEEVFLDVVRAGRGSPPARARAGR